MVRSGSVWSGSVRLTGSIVPYEGITSTVWDMLNHKPFLNRSFLLGKPTNNGLACIIPFKINDDLVYHCNKDNECQTKIGLSKCAAGEFRWRLRVNWKVLLLMMLVWRPFSGGTVEQSRPEKLQWKNKNACIAFNCARDLSTQILLVHVLSWFRGWLLFLGRFCAHLLVCSIRVVAEQEFHSERFRNPRLERISSWFLSSKSNFFLGKQIDESLYIWYWSLDIDLCSCLVLTECWSWSDQAQWCSNLLWLGSDWTATRLR